MRFVGGGDYSEKTPDIERNRGNNEKVEIWEVFPILQLFNYISTFQLPPLRFPALSEFLLSFFPSLFRFQSRPRIIPS